MPHRYAPRGESAEDLVAVVLPQQRHRDDEHTGEFGEKRRGGVDHEAPPYRQVLEVGHLGEPLLGQQPAQLRARQPGVVQGAVRDQIDQFAGGAGLARTERTVDPDDHGSPSSVAPCGLPATPRSGNPRRTVEAAAAAPTRPASAPITAEVTVSPWTKESVA